MILNQLGELGLLQRIRRRLPAGSNAVPIGIGDDAAVLRVPSGWDLIATTDMLVEGIDFNRAYGSTFPQIGYKALAVNLSDVAAMGGQPIAFLVGLAAPGSTAVRAVDEIYRGMRSLSRRHGVRLIGGDLSASEKGLFITVTVLGRVETGRAVSRSGARVGDRLYVTGTLGDSRAGLEILKQLKRKNPLKQRDFRSRLVRRHVFPAPRVAIGRWLGRTGWATAMIDLSDGLASDVRHLCVASGIGARLELARLPISDALRSYTKHAGRTPAEYALQGGEDFELLFTVAKVRVAAFEPSAKKMGFRITRIGEIVQRRRGITMVERSGRETPLTFRGYEHFTHPE